MRGGLKDRLTAALLPRLLRTLSLTWRIREEIPSDCRPIVEGSSVAVIAFWHGQMFPLWYRFRNRRWGALISGSRDGEILADYLTGQLGYGELIRGSSSRGGREALERAVEVLGKRGEGEGRTLLITPDGPRGPNREPRPGALILAERSGHQLMLAGWRCSRSIRFRSWDRMEIPLPFALITFRYRLFTPEMESNRFTEKELDRFRSQLSSLFS